MLLRVPSRKAPEIRAGDTVLVRYVSGVEGSLKVTLSDRVTDPDNGVIHTASPLGQTLLGMEEGDEIEVLVGNRVRKAEIEKCESGVTCSQCDLGQGSGSLSSRPRSTSSAAFAIRARNGLGRESAVGGARQAQDRGNAPCRIGEV